MRADPGAISQEIIGATGFAQVEKAEPFFNAQSRLGNRPDYVIKRHGRHVRAPEAGI